MAVYDPFPEPFLIFVQRKIPVLGHLLYRLFSAESGVRIYQFLRRQGASALFALVSVSLVVSALRAGTHNVAVGQEYLGCGIEELLAFPFYELAPVIQFLEEFGCCFRVNL